jgi:phospholipase C
MGYLQRRMWLITMRWRMRLRCAMRITARCMRIRRRTGCMWSGTIDASECPKGKKKNGPGFGERHQTNGFTWTTYPERLEKAGISWKLYQGGTGIKGDPTDNYTDNSLEFFAQYQVQEGADPKGPLVQKGVTDRSLIGFREDVVSGKLAQVNVGGGSV